MTPSSPLQAVYSYNLSQPGLHMISTFSYITDCALSAPVNSSLDLGPVDSLPNLRSLTLHKGKFNSLPINLSFTSLGLFESEVITPWDCSCTNSLRHLSLYDSKLGVNSSGISVCAALTHLDFVDSIFAAADARNTFVLSDDMAPCTPSTLSCLTCLQNLEVYASSRLEFHLSMHWLLSLTMLRSLDCCLGRSTDLSVELCGLPLLTSLSLRTHQPCKNQWLTLSLRWDRMLRLKTIELSGNIIFDDDILSMTNMLQLESVLLESINPFDSTSAMCLGALSFCMGKHCPNVQFHSDGFHQWMDHGWISDKF